MAESKLRELSMEFSVDIINLVKFLKANHESVIAKQIGRSGTSIGANIHEAQYAQGGEVEKRGALMKIMSFNTQHCLNFITGEIDFDVMAEAIKSVDADIVGLNEMRGESDAPEYTEQVKKLAELTGMPYYYFAPAINRRGPYGNGFLSRIPIVNAENIPIPDPNPRRFETRYETRCILKAELEGGITVLVSHFGLNEDEKENAVATVLRHICDQKCILMGDFNLRPENALLDPIRARLRDTAEVFDGEKLSHPSDNPDKKIDYIFVSRDLAVVDADILPIVASDHRPHTATVTV